MELFDLQKLVANKECPKFLIFVGEDYAVANLYIQNISKVLGLQKREIDTLQNLFVESIGNELDLTDKLFVMRYPKDVVAKEDMWSKINDKIGDNYVIMLFNDLDKRTKFYTKNKDIIVNFAPQDDKVFVSMVKPLTKMCDKNIKELGAICKNNYGKFLSELDKIKNYSIKNNISEDEAFGHLISSGTIYTGNKDVIFEFVNKVMDADVNMYKYYKILKQNSESNIKIISLIYTAMRNQFIVQTVNNPTQESTGLAPFILGQCNRRRGKYSESNLREALRLIQKVEQGVKMGIFEESFIVDYFLSELLL